MFLPIELIDIILEYNGSIKKRLGKYMNQINLNNKKYYLVKEFINKKIIIVNEIKKKFYFLIDRQSKLKFEISKMYSITNFPKCTKRIIYRTIHQLIPPYKDYYFYIWEHFSSTAPEL